MTIETEGQSPNPPHSPEEFSHQHEAVRKELRSWGITLLIFGVLHIVASGFLSSSFGVMLIVVGLASFYFRSASMLVVYAVTLAWAGISNLTSGEWLWIGFAALQGFFCFRILRRFLHYREAEAALEAPSDLEASGLTPQRTAKVFPWAGFFLGGFSLLALVAAFGLVIVLVIISTTETMPTFLSILEDLAVSAGVLGFALGLASLLCRYRWKIVAIMGMIAGLLTLIIEVVVGLIF
ncbi:MAG: hypothetical protein GWN58_56450 [Anaerolineae bacterium]|nr:hypothetical protein [Anaerolineae bacterium]